MNLSDLRGFPPEAAAHLADVHAIRTVEDFTAAIPRYVAPTPGEAPAGPIRATIACLGVPEQHRQQCLLVLLLHYGESQPKVPATEKKPRKPRAKKGEPAKVEGEQSQGPTVVPTVVADAETLPAMESSVPLPAASMPSAPTGDRADFTEHTPPPQIRPRGEPIPTSYTLGKGETAIDRFREWYREGRTPCDAVLVEWVGTYGNYPGGLKFICASRETVASGIADSLADWPTVCTLFGKGATFLVLMPPGKSAQPA